MHDVMKSDQDLLRAWSERNGKPRLLTEATVLQLMAKARQEVENAYKSKLPKIEQLQDEFNVELAKTKNDLTLAACYKRLTPDKTAWVWFTNGAAAVIKRFKAE
jgi:hypothetical protein